MTRSSSGMALSISAEISPTSSLESVLKFASAIFIGFKLTSRSGTATCVSVSNLVVPIAGFSAVLPRYDTALNATRCFHLSQLDTCGWYTRIVAPLARLYMRGQPPSIGADVAAVAAGFADAGVPGAAVVDPGFAPVCVAGAAAGAGFCDG